LGGGASEAPSQAEPGSQSGGGINLNTLLTAGAAYLQASQQGAAPPQALIKAVMAGSQMNASPHHTQSGQLVAGTLTSTQPAAQAHATDWNFRCRLIMSHLAGCCHLLSQTSFVVLSWHSFSRKSGSARFSITIPKSFSVQILPSRIG